MNSVQLVGRLTVEPELRYVGEDTAVSSFTIAVDKFVKGEKQADFIRCKVWGKQAESLAEFMGKGDRIGLVGSIETGSYDDSEGNKRYTTEVRADRVEFLTSKKTEETKNTNNSSNTKGNASNNSKSNYKNNRK